MRKKIFVFIGVIGSGKDFIANQYIQKYDAIKTAFADPLREDVWKLLRWRPKTDEEYEAFKIAVFTSPLGISFTGRDILLRYGTEIRREEDSNHWCKQTAKRIERLFNGDVTAAVITDCRFGNEVEYLKAVAEKLNADIKFTFCNFNSFRYNPSEEHESEKLSQSFLRMGFEHLDVRFDEYVKAKEFAYVPSIKFELY